MKTAMMAPGMRGRILRMMTRIAREPRPTAVVCQLMVWKLWESRLDRLGTNSAGRNRGLAVLAQVEDGDAAEVFDLAGADRDGDAGGEAGGDGVGDELDHGAEAEEAHERDDDAGHERGHGEAFVAVALGDAEDDGDEGGGGGRRPGRGCRRGRR